MVSVPLQLTVNRGSRAKEKDDVYYTMDTYNTRVGHIIVLPPLTTHPNEVEQNKSLAEVLLN